MFYFLLVVSIMPRCSCVSAVLDADTMLSALRALLLAYWDVVLAILLESYVSLAALGFIALIAVVFARGGEQGHRAGGNVDRLLQSRNYRRLLLILFSCLAVVVS